MLPSDASAQAPVSQMPASQLPISQNDVQPKKTDIPAIDLPLSGQFLIEASAGTGKTWTLTGIVLRLLVEAGYPCEKIIATTFTRSAAADIQTRIRERLTDFMQILTVAQQVMAMMASKDNDKAFLPSLAPDNPADTSQAAVFLAMIEKLGHQQGQRLIIEKEPVYWHLLTWLANQQFFDTQTMPETSPITLSIAQYRCRTALNQLDKLYVGTLDSLCQKWLREFSAETGYQPDIQITTNPEPLIKSMLHDQIRAFQEAIYINDRLLYDKLQAGGQLPKVDDYYKAVEKALTFYTAPIDDVPVNHYDLSNITALIKKINQADTMEFDNYLDSDYRESQGMSRTPALYKNFDCWENIRWLLAAQAEAGVWRLSGEEQKWLNSLSENIYQNKHFKKGYDKQLHAFQSLEITQLLAELAFAIEQANQKSDSIRHYFTQFISQYVRQQLPIVLESKRQTTFSLQLARLNQALASKQGEALARYIRHQYPVALIDESQDINTEQAMLLQKIYLSDKKPPKNTTHVQASAKTNNQDNADTQTKPSRQFLLLVGDPKQAIYGFRGGDVVNYTQLKRQFNKANIHELTQNHRSSATLVNGLNHWFGFPAQSSDPKVKEHSPEPTLAQDKPYFLGDSIEYRPITAHRTDSLLTTRQPESNEKSVTTLKDSQNIDDSNPSLAIFLLHTDVLNQQQLVTHEAMQEQSNQEQSNQEIDIENADVLPATILQSKPITTETVIAAQILALFDTDSFDKGNGAGGYQYKGRPLKFADIGILATSHRLLDGIERQLHNQNIPTMRGGNQSLFAGEMAQILVILMNTLIYPQHMARLKRLLMTPLFGLNLSQVEQLLQQDSVDMPAKIGLKNSPSATVTDIQNSLSNTNKQWQKHGFLSALQSWLDISFQLAEENQLMNFWQRLAGQPTGERLLIDLRHLMDVISQYTKGMGEHQILDWLSLMVSEQPKEDWCTQQRLSSEDGVQLMTMHTSKGLEFPIVFAVGLDMGLPPDTRAKSAPALYLYNASSVHSLMDSSASSPQSLPVLLPTHENQAKGQDLRRRLSPRAYFTDEAAAEYKKIEKQAEYEDKLRLAYVALTRAKDRLYITASQPSKSANGQKTTPLCRWLDPATLTVPEALSASIATVNINSLSKFLFIKNKTANTAKQSTPNTTAYQAWIAHISQTQFKGWSNTSFTALTHHLNQDQLANATSEPDYASIDESPEVELTGNEDVLFESQNFSNSPSTALAIRFGFEKGARAGTFLHHILENLMDDTSARLAIADDIDGMTGGSSQTNDWQPNSAWSHIIDKAVKEAQLSSDLLSGAEENNVTQPLANESMSHLALARWLREVMLTPLGASGVCLQQIPKSQKLAELGFNMSLQADFSLENLQNLFDTYQIALNFTLNQPQNQYWRYLKGEIDFVYQHEGRFYIVDYKSNWLGENFAAYHETALRQTMTAHGYWLQASIYQVALHRYLSLRLPNYDIKTHLGAVEYAFIRGMSASLPEYGKLVWQPDSDFILALDKVLGRAVS